MMIKPSSAPSATINVSCDGRALQQVSNHRCLGVIIVDSQLSWSDHVGSVAAKVSQNIGCLRRIWGQLSENARRLYFLAVIQPYLEFCAVVTCTQLSRKDRERLLEIRRHAFMFSIKVGLLLCICLQI